MINISSLELKVAAFSSSHYTCQLRAKGPRFISTFNILAESESPGSTRLVHINKWLFLVTELQWDENSIFATRVDDLQALTQVWPCNLGGAQSFSSSSSWGSPPLEPEPRTFPPLGLGETKTCDFSCLTRAIGSTPKSKSGMNSLVTSANQVTNKY